MTIIIIIICLITIHIIIMNQELKSDWFWRRRTNDYEEELQNITGIHSSIDNRLHSDGK